MMTSAQVVETSVNVTLNSPSQDYTHPDDRTPLSYVIFIVINISIINGISSCILLSVCLLTRFFHAHSPNFHSEKHFG